MVAGAGPAPPLFGVPLDDVTGVASDDHSELARVGDFGGNLETEAMIRSAEGAT